MSSTPYPYPESQFRNEPGLSGPFLEGPAEFLAEERKAYCNELSTPLHVALIEFEHAEDLRELIQEASNINAQDAEGHTPLHMLCYRESCEYAVAEMLLAEGTIERLEERIVLGKEDLQYEQPDTEFIH